MMEIKTTTVQIKYYSPENDTGPSVGGWCQGNDNPDSTISVKLKSDETFFAEIQKVYRAVYDLSAHRSFLFRLMVPAQTRSLCSIIASLFPATTSLIAAVGNPIIVLLGMIFSMIIDLPTLPIRLITLIPRAILQCGEDCSGGSIWIGELAGYKIEEQYFPGDINWARGRLAVDGYYLSGNTVLGKSPEVFFLGY